MRLVGAMSAQQISATHCITSSEALAQALLHDTLKLVSVLQMVVRSTLTSRHVLSHMQCVQHASTTRAHTYSHEGVQTRATKQGSTGEVKVPQGGVAWGGCKPYSCQLLAYPNLHSTACTIHSMEAERHCHCSQHTSVSARCTMTQHTPCIAWKVDTSFVV